ncbi:MAG: SDR family NAD(P)-dependent oxidoreductase [Deltaproteobacteria bacterium]|nr:SDR family NAD(P)-dependent oxidoreductase [Deltaproteobacteria bacterium]
MSNELRFDGKVAIVTGAGGGLGRSHALLLASRGAKVVVNDLGGGFTGDGKSSRAADAVVDEIKAAGGTAVGNYDSVEDGDKIVKTAIDAFGQIDIVINNAGILRDVSFPKMTQQDWDLIYKVHVLGAFKVTYAAWPYMRDQGYGRVIMTASAAGIYGNFGQANYAMAKLGLVGFANSLAIEGKRKNVLVNTIAPLAGSRMTETVLPKDLIDVLKPEYVSPLVARLCHESSEETGALFEVGGGFFGKLRWERSSGKTFRVGRAISIENVNDAWKDITQFAKTTHPENITASMQPIMENLQAGPSKGGNALIDVDAALGYEYPPMEASYDERDLALYALGVGAAKDPNDPKDLQLVYELHGQGMKALPTYGVVPAINMMFALGKQGKSAPGLNFGLDRVLHGEQYTELKRPLPTHARLTHKARIKDIFDKGKNALVVTEFTSTDETGAELIKNEVVTFVRGAGGWGGERGPSADVNVPPERAPDAVVEEKTSENQALLYRLSGDWNPLHADPGFAKAFGFEKPILHGLCTFGFAGRQVVQKFAPDGNPDYFKSIRVRFAASVMPGDTLITEMWKESATKVVFRVKVKERDQIVISNAAIEFFTEIPKPAAKAKAAPAAAKSVPNSGDIFRAIGTFIGKNPDTVDRARTVFQFKLSAPDSVWTINLKDAPGGVVEGAGAAPQCTLDMSDADFMAMATGKEDAMKLFSSGKLKISGDVMASQKLGFLKKLTPEMVIAEMNKRLGAGGGEAAAAPAAAGEYQPTAADVFIVIADHLARNPEMVGKVGAVYLFKIKDPDASWTVDLKNGAGAVTEGGTAADCTLEISEKDFLDMTTGKADAMKLFTSGKLRISGNVMLSQKLDFLSKIPQDQAKAAVMKVRGGAPAKAAVPAAASAPKSAAAPAVIAALTKRLAEHPELRGEIAAVIAFKVTDPAAAFTIDGTGAAAKVSDGVAANATTTITIKDGDLQALASGAKTARDLYQHGALRVDGDISVAHRLGFFKGLV